MEEHASSVRPKDKEDGEKIKDVLKTDRAKLRKALYRLYVYEIYGHLGKGNRVRIPGSSGKSKNNSKVMKWNFIHWIIDLSPISSYQRHHMFRRYFFAFDDEKYQLIRHLQAQFSASETWNWPFAD